MLLICRAATVVLTAFTIAVFTIADVTQRMTAFASNQTNTHEPGFFQRHPKFKKYLIMGGVGAATGGVGAVVMGKGVVSSAAVGVGTHIGEHEASAKYKEHKAQKNTQGKVVSTKHQTR
jgi:hypothetical protein